MTTKQAVNIRIPFPKGASLEERFSLCSAVVGQQIRGMRQADGDFMQCFLVSLQKDFAEYQVIRTAKEETVA